MTDLSAYLFGNILTIGSADLWILGCLALATSLMFILLMQTIVSIAFDPVFARSQHLPVTLIEYVMMILIAMTIVATLRMIGIVLVMGLLTIPQMTANLFTYNFRTMSLLSIFFGLLFCVAGLAVSYWLNVPSGASIIFVAIIIYVLLKTIKSIQSKFLKE